MVCGFIARTTKLGSVLFNDAFFDNGHCALPDWAIGLCLESCPINRIPRLATGMMCPFEQTILLAAFSDLTQFEGTLQNGSTEIVVSAGFVCGPTPCHENENNVSIENPTLSIQYGSIEHEYEKSAISEISWRIHRLHPRPIHHRIPPLRPLFIRLWHRRPRRPCHPRIFFPRIHQLRRRIYHL